MIKIICSNETIEFNIEELLKIESNKTSIELHFDKVIKTVTPDIEYLDAINNVQNLGSLLRVFQSKTYEINREFELKNCMLLTSIE